MRMQRIAENYYVSLPLSMVMVFLPLLNWIGLSWAVFAVLRLNTYIGILSMAAVGFTCFYVFNGLQFQNAFIEWLVLLVFIGPLWAMAYSLRLFRSLSLSLQLGYFVLVLMAVWLYGVSGPTSFEELHQLLLERLFAGEIASGGVSQTMQHFYLQTMAKGAIYAWPSMFFMFQVLLLVFARFVQSRWYYPGGFQGEFHALRLSRWMSVPLVLSFLWAIFAPSQVAIQIAGLSALLYSIAGLAYLHWYMQAKQLSTIWVVLLYGVLFALSAWALPLLAVMALLDSYLDLRSRLKR